MLNYDTANTLKIDDFCAQMVDFYRPSHIYNYKEMINVATVCIYVYVCIMFGYYSVSIFLLKCAVSIYLCNVPSLMVLVVTCNLYVSVNIHMCMWLYTLWREDFCSNAANKMIDISKVGVKAVLY